MGDLSKNFWSREFECPCCGQSHMNPDFINKLQKLRDLLGMPVGIVEGGGFRCDAYDPTKSAHKEGRAADLDLNYADYYAALQAAFEVGMTGIGVKNKGRGKDKRFQLHLDDAEAIPGRRPRPWVWTY